MKETKCCCEWVGKNENRNRLSRKILNSLEKKYWAFVRTNYITIASTIPTPWKMLRLPPQTSHLAVKRALWLESHQTLALRIINCHSSALVNFSKACSAMPKIAMAASQRLLAINSSLSSSIICNSMWPLPHRRKTWTEKATMAWSPQQVQALIRQW